MRYYNSTEALSMGVSDQNLWQICPNCFWSVYGVGHTAMDLHARHAVTPAFDVSVVDCSGDFGKNMTQLDLPDDERVESLTAAVVGLWVAIHTVNITSDQHEVRFFNFLSILELRLFHPAWGMFAAAAQTARIDAFLKRAHRSGFRNELAATNGLLTKYVYCAAEWNAKP